LAVRKSNEIKNALAFSINMHFGVVDLI
jgi:hypothetical protein